MSQLYGLFAGLFVCLPTWAAMTYVSAQVGLLVGLFLMTFFVVATVYVNGDEMSECYKKLTKTFTDMEIIFFDKLKTLESKIETSRDDVKPTDSETLRLEAAAGNLDKMINMVEHILNDHDRADQSGEHQGSQDTRPLEVSPLSDAN